MSLKGLETIRMVLESSNDCALMADFFWFILKPYCTKLRAVKGTALWREAQAMRVT